MKEKIFTWKKAKSKRYSAILIIDADYVDDLVFITNTPAQTKSLLHSLEQAEKGMNTDKMEFMCFKQDGDISTLNAKLLKSVDYFTYLGSNISSTESIVNICRGKALTAVDWLSTIWKSNPSNKIKREFFQVEIMSVQLYGRTTSTLKKHLEKKLKRNFKRMLHAVLNKF